MSAARHRVGMDELRRRGELSRHDTRGRYVRLYRDVYVPRDLELTAAIRARAAWMSTGCPLAGLSAAAVHGTKWLNPAAPAEVLRQDRHTQPGMVAHSFAVAPEEFCLAGGLPVTTPARTAFDIGRRVPTQRAIPILDALLGATGVAVDEVVSVIDRWPGVRGVRRCRSLLTLVDGAAESPQESRLRLILVHGGLPAPECQIRFPDLRIRVDMGWRQWRVAVEYDGVQHWTDGRQRAWDIERVALLEAAGWVVVRVSAQMMARPDLIVARVLAKLKAAGYRE